MDTRNLYLQQCVSWPGLAIRPSMTLSKIALQDIWTVVQAMVARGRTGIQMWMSISYLLTNTRQVWVAGLVSCHVYPWALTSPTPQWPVPVKRQMTAAGHGEHHTKISLYRVNTVTVVVTLKSWLLPQPFILEIHICRHHCAQKEVNSWHHICTHVYQKYDTSSLTGWSLHNKNTSLLSSDFYFDTFMCMGLFVGMYLNNRCRKNYLYRFGKMVFLPTCLEKKLHPTRL